MTRSDEIEMAFEKAVRFAIEQMGMVAFKSTSFFGSQDPKRQELDKAA